MNKEEFLRHLRQALAGDVPQGVIEENIRYYDSYITGEVRNGQSEESVIASIGDPRLIAKTIVDTTEGAGEGAYADASDDRSRGGYGQSTYERETYERNPYQTDRHFHMIDLSKWYWKLLLVVVVFSIISIVISVVGGIFMILAPFIGPLFILWLIVWIFRSFYGRR